MASFGKYLTGFSFAGCMTKRRAQPRTDPGKTPRNIGRQQSNGKSISITRSIDFRM
jgi:hypothetical protein